MKIIFLLKRKPSMSCEEFQQYYESTHRVLVLKHLPGAFYYARRYLRPGANNSGASGATQQDFDVITELWFETEAAYEASAMRLSQPDIRAMIEDDEAKLFDRDATRFFILRDERMDATGGHT